MVNLDITQDQLEILFDILPSLDCFQAVYRNDSYSLEIYKDLKHKIYSEVVKNENL